MNRLSDWHIHTSFSSDSEASMESIIQKAIELNLASICFTDHNDYNYPEFDNDGKMLFQLDIESYINSIIELKDKYKEKIDIYTGIEQGLQPGIYDIVNDFDSLNRFDFIIGSSHLINGADPYYPDFWQNHNAADIINLYFESIITNICGCNNFDVYGHLDYIIRYAPKQDLNYSWTDYKDKIDTILSMLIECGKGIEINTAGLKYGLQSANPSQGILHRYKELGGEIITIGSDAHAPEFLAFEFNIISDILSSAGFNYYTIFKNRKPEFISLR